MGTAPPERRRHISEPRSDASGIAELAEFGLSSKSRRSERHHRDRADHHKQDAYPQICALVGDEARADALVDDVALLEKQLPRRHSRADDRDYQQHHLAQGATLGQPRHEEIAGHLADRGMGGEEDWHEQQATEDEY
jgi:hypothetical protein